MYTRNPNLNESRSRFNSYPWLAPRCWHGMSVSTWIEFLRENRFNVDAVSMALGVSLFAPATSFFNRLQHLLYSRRAKATPLETDPIFVLGHWRTGTTFLQYLLGLDKRYHTPSTLECMMPRQFLVSGFTSRLMWFPSQRPMDNVDIGWDTPQEDEFALCVGGATSVFRHIGFPFHGYQHTHSITLDESTAEQRALWKKELLQFVRYLNFRHRKPLFLKSPAHTGRVHALLEMFPNARFIHLTRHPTDFIPSTIFLWQSLDATSGFQKNIDQIDHEDYVLDCFRLMYKSFEKRKSLIPSANLCEVSYDDLTGDTERTLHRIYRELRLGDFEPVADVVQEHLSARRDYKRNQHEISPRLRTRILLECRDYIAKYCNRYSAERRTA